MAKTIAFANQKGGVGKTTTTINLGAALAWAGKRCLLVDLDPQANTTSGLGVEEFDVRQVGQFLLEPQTIRESVVSTSQEGLAVIPSAGNLQQVAHRLSRLADGEARLAPALKPLGDVFDYILVDCPPSLGLLTRNALNCCSRLVIPIQCEYFAMEGLSKMVLAVRDIQHRQNPALKIAGILLTMYDHQLDLSREVVEEVKSHFPKLVFRTIIPRDIALSEASSFGQSVFTYAPRSRGAWGYLQLAREVLSHERKEIGSRT